MRTGGLVPEVKRITLQMIVEKEIKQLFETFINRTKKIICKYRTNVGRKNITYMNGQIAI